MNNIGFSASKLSFYQRPDVNPSPRISKKNQADAYDEAAPMAACRSGDLSRLKAELSKDPSAVFREYRSGRTGVMSSLLQLAAQQGHSEICNTLLDCGADPNMVTSTRATALLAACQNGHVKTVECLLNHNADPNLARSSDGITPLSIASQNGHHKVAALLLSRFADVDRDRTDNITPLLIAALNGHSKVVELLLRNNADINCVSREGMTPLFAAAKNGHAETVKVLLASRPNLGKGWEKLGTPALTRDSLRVAKSGGYDSEIIAMLKAAIKERESYRTVPEEKRSLLDDHLYD